MGPAPASFNRLTQVRRKPESIATISRSHRALSLSQPDHEGEFEPRRSSRTARLFYQYVRKSTMHRGVLAPISIRNYLQMFRGCLSLNFSWEWPRQDDCLAIHAVTAGAPVTILPAYAAAPCRRNIEMT